MIYDDIAPYMQWLDKYGFYLVLLALLLVVGVWREDVISFLQRLYEKFYTS